MTTADKKNSSTATTKAGGNSVVQKITRRAQIFLLFWVDENDSGRKMFKEAAQTRLIIIKTEPWYDPLTHKVHCPNITHFSQIQKTIDYWINHYGGEGNAFIQEVSFFSHAGINGPIIYNAYKFDSSSDLLPIYRNGVENPKRNQMIELKWATLNYHWLDGTTRLNFFGCRTAIEDNSHKKAFAKKISSYINCKDVIVSGQSNSSYPSFLPDLRITTDYIALNFGWDYTPTFMVASKKGNGIIAMTSRNAVTLKMLFFKNTRYLQAAFQSIFNDYRTPRTHIQTPELTKVQEWNRLGF